MIDLSTTKMICLRKVADSETAIGGESREALLRDENGFLLYHYRKPSTGPAEEQLMRVAAREALVWLNEQSDCTRSID